MAPAAGLRARVAFLRSVDGEAIAPGRTGATARSSRHSTSGSAPFLVRATGSTDLSRVDVAMALSSQLTWDDQVDLSELAPPTLRDAVRSHDARSTTRAIHPPRPLRVQDLFGMTAHPTIAAGRVPVTLELLSPADRPVQITRDLPGFWRGSWADVRKDMAGRYPKHHWPADPSVAPPKRLKPDG